MILGFFFIIVGAKLALTEKSVWKAVTSSKQDYSWDHDREMALLFEYHIKGCCAEIPGLMDITRNKEGNITSMKGVSLDILEWMSRRFGLTYDCDVTTTTVENVKNSIGGLPLLTAGTCNTFVGPVVQRHDRFLQANFLHPWQIDPVVLLIPMPSWSTDASAILKPFNLNVWLLLLVSTFLVTFVITGADYYFKKENYRTRISLHWLFVVGMLFGRAAFWASRKLQVRLLMGCWALTAVIFTITYSSELTSFIMAQVPLPIVISYEDLARQPGLDLVVLQGYAPDLTISKSTDPLMTKLADKINKNPTARCPDIWKCVDSLKNKENTVFIHQLGPVLVCMMKDLHQTKKCNLALAKNNFANYPGAWMIRKQDPRLEYYNRGMLRMVEMGLVTFWQNVHQPKPVQCFDQAKQQSDIRQPEKIGMKHLYVLFVMLLVGYFVSFIIILCEIWVKCFCFSFT